MCSMYRGIDYWDNFLTDDMVEKTVLDNIQIYTYPNLPKNLYMSFERSANRLPEKTAIVDDKGVHINYETLSNRVDLFSSWLVSKAEVKKGNHVALMLYNSVEFCVALLALNRIGAVAVPMPTKYKKMKFRLFFVNRILILCLVMKNFSTILKK